MTPKIGNQHYLLHYYYPNDCCLCKSETLNQELKQQLEDSQSIYDDLCMEIDMYKTYVSDLKKEIAELKMG